MLVLRSMKSSLLPFLCWIIVLLLSHCGSDDMVSITSPEEDSIIVNSLTTIGNDSAIRDDNGIYRYPIVLNPVGDPASESVLSIYYTLSILDSDGTIASHSRDDGDPLVMRQGVNAIYPVGLDLALANMREGETYGFIIPSGFAYDTVSFSSIPQGSIVEFQVELVEVRSIDEVNNEEATAIENYVDAIDDIERNEREAIIQSIIDSFPEPLSATDSTDLQNSLDSLALIPLDTFNIIGPFNNIYWKSLDGGNAGSGRPLNGSRISINYTGSFLDSTFFDTRFETAVFRYDFNAGFVIPGLDIGIGEMEFGETAVMVIPSSLAYAESAAVIPESFVNQAIESMIVPDYVARVSPYQPLVFEVTLLESSQ